MKGVIVPVRCLVGRVLGLASRAFTPYSFAVSWTLCAPPLPACGLSGPGLGRRTATGAVGFARALDVTVSGFHKGARALLAITGPGVTVRGHTGPATGHEIGCFFPLIIHLRRIEVSGLGGVAGIALRLLLPPGIVATLGQGCSLPLQWGAVTPPSPCLSCRTLPGCSSACWGPVLSGMRSWALHFWLLASLVPWCCLVLLLRSRQQLPLHVCECSRSRCGFSRWCCLCDWIGRSA